MSRSSAAIEMLAKLYPYDVEASDELAESLSFIEASHDAETVVRAGFGAGIVSLVSIVPLLVLPIHPIYALFFVFLIAFGVVHAIHSGPHVLAAFRRTRALGDTPNLIGRAVLRMEIQPSTETAVRFAADTGFGPLANSLGAHIDRAMGTPRTGLVSFAEEWAEDFPALRRSAHLLSTAEDAPEAERVATLDRSLDAILNGTREQMSEFTNSIRGPTTALYAFGVMLPMALVALVPAAGMVESLSLGIAHFVLIYDVFLPVGLVAASAWLLVRRPVAFPPPDVDRGHPDVPSRRWLPVVAGLAVGGTGTAIVYVAGPGYLAPIAAIGLTLGTTLLVYFHPIKEVRAYIRRVEDHLVDALYLVGRQVSEGEAVEPAIELAGDRVPGETGDVFETAAGLQRRLHLGVEDAFLGKYGALNGIPSPRARGTASLLSIAADEGKPAGRAIVSMADHLEELSEVEKAAKRELSKVTETLDSTAAYFGPLVAGATVAMANNMRDIDAGEKSLEVLPPGQLGMTIGVYVLAMSVILTTLSIGLRNGLDRSLVGYHVGRSLVSGVIIFVLSVAVTGMLIGGVGG